MGSKIVQWCDICGSSMANRKGLRIPEKEKCYDVCMYCVKRIVQRVFDKELLVLTPWCKVCNGTREVIKEDTSSTHHYDREKPIMEQCKACKV